MTSWKSKMLIMPKTLVRLLPCQAWKTFGIIDINAAIEGIELFSEHVEAAENHPGRHPNIDRLLQVIEDESTLKIKIIK